MADVLLDQRVAAGLGNVYKSELLFLAGEQPERRLEETPDAVLQTLLAEGARVLRSNLGGGRRVTRTEPDTQGRLWVYGRAGQPCLRCGAAVRRARPGRHQRSTYWCPPHCQAPEPAAR